MVSPLLGFFLTALVLLVHPYSIAAKLSFKPKAIVLPTSKDQSITLIKQRTPLAAGTSFRPKALVLPVSKDPSTNQYLTEIKQRTPLVPIKLTLDLGGQCLWVDEQDYVSSTYKHVRCATAQCAFSISTGCVPECYTSPPRPGCNNNTCGYVADNPILQSAFVNAEVGQDVVSIQSTDGSNPGRAVSVPKFTSTVAITSMLQGLANGVKGMAGLGRTRISLPSQFSSAFSFDRKFAICLSSSTNGNNGVVFFGDGPYVLLPNIDVSKSLIYTPLVVNPVSVRTTSFEGESSSDYFIGVTSIKINGNKVPLNTTLLKIDKQGSGGTKISTVNPYTVMETSIYKAVVKSFIKELAQVPRVSAVAPFGACFNSTFIGSTRVGPAVPQIDLVLQSSRVIWSIFGANSIVNVKEDVVCLGFVDGGVNSKTSIEIGGHQLEDNLLQFDLAASKLGFSSSLLFRQTNCANFNFTSNA
ncbi:probable aspartic proteinase GIP2 [Euphorbia lathyris]|uniref:probable aspartic proteinase GIP2 n=1 Tax=Euphorbia lathyris TaxID=212925 RepID=UPI0033137F78